MLSDVSEEVADCRFVPLFFCGRLIRHGLLHDRLQMGQSMVGLAFGSQVLERVAQCRTALSPLSARGASRGGELAVQLVLERIERGRQGSIAARARCVLIVLPREHLSRVCLCREL
jgi:hypothetical protein